MARLFFPQFAKSASGIEVHPGLTILDCARRAGIEIRAECNGNGTCGTCAVRIERGAECLNHPTPHETKAALGPGERLACQARIVRPVCDIVAYIRDFGRYEILRYAEEREIPLQPACVRRGNAVVRDGAEIDRWRGKMLGVALDVGTTTIVLDLVDLETGDVLETAARLNPQISYGNDIISRIDHVTVHKDEKRYLTPDERAVRVAELQKAVVAAVNDELARIAGELGEDVGSCVYETVVVGNPTMRDLFFGRDVSSLGVRPFEPLSTEPVTASPGEIGLSVNPAGRVYGASLIGGHLGADALANVLATDLHRAQQPSMVVDIGTNGEVVVGNRDRIIGASAAAGGAFEGVSVSSGIGAVEGAIKEVRIVDGQVVYSTIGNKHPIGICGSGLIDLLAELLAHGILTERARLARNFYLTADISISQQDVFHLVTSKAALRTAQQVLLRQYPLPVELLDRVFLSGGFGTFVNPASAVRIGLLVAPSEDRIIKIGNGALEGARQMLVSLERRALSERLARDIVHLRTHEVEKDFDIILADNMYFA